MISESGEGLEADTKCNTSPRRGCVPCPRSAGAGFFYQCWAAGGREEDLQLPPVPVSALCIRELLLESRLRMRGVGWGELLLPLQPPHTPRTNILLFSKEPGKHWSFPSPRGWGLAKQLQSFANCSLYLLHLSAWAAAVPLAPWLFSVQTPL